MAENCCLLLIGVAVVSVIQMGWQKVTVCQHANLLSKRPEYLEHGWFQQQLRIVVSKDTEAVETHYAPTILANPITGYATLRALVCSRVD